MQRSNNGLMTNRLFSDCQSAGEKVTRTLTTLDIKMLKMNLGRSTMRNITKSKRTMEAYKISE